MVSILSRLLKYSLYSWQELADYAKDHKVWNSGDKCNFTFHPNPKKYGERDIIRSQTEQF